MPTIKRLASKIVMPKIARIIRLCPIRKHFIYPAFIYDDELTRASVAAGLKGSRNRRATTEVTDRSGLSILAALRRPIRKF